MNDPIIILGTGRSGTKLLRSCLASHPDIAAFPKEINYIWRHGNLAAPTDELSPEAATERVKVYVRGRFDKISQKGSKVVAEKTCANCLRVAFVQAVFPEARFIHLIRDGRAVAESARRCWQRAPKLSYLLKKARWVPPSDVPYYTIRFLKFQAFRWMGERGIPASWGPRYSGIDRDVRKMSLLEVCATQWLRCVEAAEAGLRRVPREQVFCMRYEDWVLNPENLLGGLFDFLGLDFADQASNYARAHVRPDYVDRWKSRLSSAEAAAVESLLAPALNRLQYLESVSTLSE